MSAKPQDATSGRGSTGEKVVLGRYQSDPSMKNRVSTDSVFSVGVLGRARVKLLLGKFVTSPRGSFFSSYLTR